MKTRMVVGLSILAFAALLAQARQPTTYEGVVKDMLVQLLDIHKTLAGILDEESAGTARPALQKSAKKLLELRQLADTIRQPEKEEKDRLELLYRGKFEDLFRKLKIESNRVKGIAGGPEAVKELDVAKKKTQ